MSKRSYAIALLGFLACSPSSSSPQTAVVVGIQSQPLAGAIATLHVVTTLGGAPNTDETIPPTALPHEVRVTPAGGDTTATIGVEVDGYESATWMVGSSDPPLLVRTAETSFVVGQTELLRVLLQGDCLRALPGGPPGAPTCTAPQTCVEGVCASDVVAPSSLEPYTPGWATDVADVCKPANAGPPVVQVGTGQSDYLPLTDGETVQAEQGPQGGHHIWIAVRQRNLAQQGSTTTITSVQPGTNLAGPRMAFVFTFDQDEGDFCKLFGLRYQLDLDGTDYHLFLGQPLDVTVVIADPTGASGTGTAHIQIAPTLLCPSGIPGCPGADGGGADGGDAGD
ncbi:MAG TPA: hypothetical protein VIJ22_12615 [Polyangiaceae bacterium]